MQSDPAEIATTTWTVAGLRLDAAAGSVTGRRYRENYDVLHLDPDRPLAVVADGMGSGAGSRAAGRTAVDVFVRSAAATGAGLRAAVAEVQREVRRAGHGRPELTGCTLTGFVAGPDDSGVAAARIVQLGDSRAYRLRGGLLELLTTDHTVAWLGVLHGWFAAGSAEERAARYRLTRYAGHPDQPEPDVLEVALRPDDVLLLCTDGVTDQVGYEQLGRLLGAVGEGAAPAGGPARAVAELLAATLSGGGDDNATAAVLWVRPS